MQVDEQMYYVYVWYIVDTEEVFYVGKGKGGRYKTIAGRNKFFMDMYSTHNCDVKIVYDNLTEKEAFQKEKDLIKWYREDTTYRLTNQTDGGDGTSGWVPPQDFRDKQAKIHKEQWQNKEFKERMLKIRQDENGVYKSKEFREKISNLVKGENNPNYNHKWTDEMKEHLRKQVVDSKKYCDAGNPNSKSIICIETGEVFECIKYAMDKYNIKEHGSVTAALKHPFRTAGGMHWALYSEELLDKNVRFHYLIDVLLMDTRKTPAICVDTKELFSCAANLAAAINKTETYIRYHLTNNGYILHEGKKYIKLRDYIGNTEAALC